jgi:hypothetical protein
MLELHRARGAELRRQAEQARARAATPLTLAVARPRLLGIIRQLGGLAQPAKQRPPRPRDVARRPRGPIV